MNNSFSINLSKMRNLIMRLAAIHSNKEENIDRNKFDVVQSKDNPSEEDEDHSTGLS